ncbi:hypothetical protein UPYG_G00228570 [Umbra pygmaea]|uniref:Rab11 family-interacting protein 5 n=1 Tax=Umbra pygmaea TaxID=75934 RepID=A0ABD0WDW4_UMBPY
MSVLNLEEEQRWVPTHVQVTVLRGRGLRAKGKHGTSDVYTIIQVGKEKYSTCVLDKTTTPEWKEECTFELLPGVLEQRDRDGSAYPPWSSDLVLTVMHRSVIGMDVFLGQAVIPLDKLFQDRVCMKNEWCKLNSKTGKKEKERGDIQVTVQFTKNNLTASMYDLSLGKDKPRSTFGKIKDRIKGKNRIARDSDEDVPSVIIGGYGPVSRMRNRLPSDGGGEEDYEDDEGGEGRRSKMRNFFLRGKLRKSSDTRSSTSLGSESSESSSRGGSLSPTAGISVVVSDLSNSPSNSSNLTADSPEHTSPKLASYNCEFTDESGEINIPVPQPVCINGSHVYKTTPHPTEPGPINPVVALVNKRLPLSQSLQNLNQQREEVLVPFSKGTAADGRRWSFDKAGKEEKEAIAAALMQAGQGMGGGDEELHGDSQEKNQSRNHGEALAENPSGSASGPMDDQHKGWFRSKDSHNRPSQAMSPSLGLYLTTLNSPQPPNPPVCSTPPTPPLQHTNSPAQFPPFTSSHNPFLSLLLCNPFYEEILADNALKQNSVPPSLSNNPNPSPFLSTTPDCPTPQDFTDKGRKAEIILPKPDQLQSRTHTVEEEVERAGQWAKPPLQNSFVDNKSPVNQRPSKSCSVAPRKEDAQNDEAHWDDFELFAADRLKSPEESSANWTEGIKALLDDSGHAAIQNNSDVTLKNAENECVSWDHYVLTGENGGNSNCSPTPVRFIDSIQFPAPNQIESSNNTTVALDPLLLVLTSEHRITNLHACDLQNTIDHCVSTNTPKVPCHNCSLPHSPSVHCHTAKHPGLKLKPVVDRSSETVVVVSSDAACEMWPDKSSVEAEDCTNGCEDILVTHAEHVNLTVTDIVEASHPMVTDDEKPLSHQCSYITSPSGKHSHCENTSKEHGVGMSPRPPKPPRLFLSNSSPGPGPSLEFDDMLSHTKVSDRSPGSILCSTDSRPIFNSKCVYADFQLNQTSKPYSLSEEVVISKENLMLPKEEEFPKKEEQFLKKEEQFPKKEEEFPKKEEEFPKKEEEFPKKEEEYPKEELPNEDVLSLARLRLQAEDETKTVPPADYDVWRNNVIQSEALDQYRYHQRDMPVAKAKTSPSPLRMDGMVLEAFNSPALSKLLPDNFCANQSTVGVYSYDDTGNEDIRENLHCLMSPSVFQRSHSEGILLSSYCEQHLDTESLATFQHVLSEQNPLEHSLSEESRVKGLPTSSSRDPAVLTMGSRSSSQLLGSELLTSFITPPSLTAECSSSPTPSIPPPATVRSSASAALASATPTLSTAQPVIGAPYAAMPQEVHQAANERNSPHPVKPLTPEEKRRAERSEGRSVLDKLKSSIHPGKSSQSSEQDTARIKSLTEGAGPYYHLPHSQLVALLLQREADLHRQKVEFERQRALLAKREAELKKLKPQVRDLEDYIDTLLVRIMEQTPTILQVGSKLK